MRTKRSQELMGIYKEAMGACANPNCDTPYQYLHTHHVVPLKYSGVDTYINYVVLCSKCHRSKVHTDYDLKQEQLFTWKFTQEMLVVGYTADDYNTEDYGNILRSKQ